MRFTKESYLTLIFSIVLIISEIFAYHYPFFEEQNPFHKTIEKEQKVYKEWGFSSFFKRVKRSISRAYSRAKSYVSSSYRKVKSYISRSYKKVKSYVSKGYRKVKSYVSRTYKKVKSYISKAYRKIKSSISRAYNYVKSKFSSKRSSKSSSSSSRSHRSSSHSHRSYNPITRLFKCKLGATQCVKSGSSYVSKRCIGTRWISYTCGYGCANGKCVSEPKFDFTVPSETVEGKSFTVSGTVRFDGGLKQVVMQILDPSGRLYKSTTKSCYGTTCSVSWSTSVEKDGIYTLKVIPVLSVSTVRYVPTKKYTISVLKSGEWLECNKNNLRTKVIIDSQKYYCCYSQDTGFYWSVTPCYGTYKGGTNEYTCCDPQNENVICRCSEGKIISGSCRPLNEAHICKYGTPVKELSVEVLEGNEVNVSAGEIVTLHVKVKNELNEKRTFTILEPSIKAITKKQNDNLEKELKEGELFGIRDKMHNSWKETIKGRKGFTFEPKEEKVFEYQIYIPMVEVGTKIRLNFTVVGSSASDTVDLNVVRGIYPIEIEGTAYKYVDEDRVIVSNSEVTGYVCDDTVEYCDEGSKWTIKNSTITDENGYFLLRMYPILELGKTYKIGVVSEGGYAESEVTIE